MPAGRTRGGRRPALTIASVVVIATVLAACGSGDGDDNADQATTATIPKQTAHSVACKDAASDGDQSTAEVDVLVENLERQASLEDAESYDEFVPACDNTSVTNIEIPAAYDDVEPSPFAPPQTALRASPDLSARVEDEPIVNVFAAPTGGSQFPTRPGFGTVIQQSADGSLSSGTREPREGKTITEDCTPLPARDLAFNGFIGRAQFFVNCGHEQRAWVLVAAAPANADPYFIQLVAQVKDTADAEAVGHALTSLTVDKDALAAFTATQETAAPASEAPSTTVPAAP